MMRAAGARPRKRDRGGTWRGSSSKEDRDSDLDAAERQLTDLFMVSILCLSRNKIFMPSWGTKYGANSKVTLKSHLSLQHHVDYARCRNI